MPIRAKKPVAQTSTVALFNTAIYLLITETLILQDLLSYILSSLDIHTTVSMCEETAFLMSPVTGKKSTKKVVLGKRSTGFYS